jgi:hypothetical protein
VRVDEPQCPFCGGSVGAAQPIARAVAHASRVAILFAGAVGVAGCGSNDVPVYGAPFPADAVSDTGSTKDSGTDTASSDTGGAVPPYGAPFTDDSGTD